jgi:LPXTG-motif cell wall-anchored protein
MRHRRRLALALVSMAAMAAGAAFGAPALAATPTGDPGGNNGTVKIDGVLVDSENDNDVDNEPHVPCTFEVEFFGFDLNQKADIKLYGHPPSSEQPRFDLLIDLQDQVVSDDSAAGADQDADRVFPFSVADLEEAGLEPHPNQGFHLRLDVFSPGLPGGQKHKTFWVEPCPPSPSGSSPSNGNGNGSSPPPPPPPPTNGKALPVTGAAATTIGLTGVALIGGGAALLWFRRRRDNVTFES